MIGSTACTQTCGNGFYGDNNTLTCTACPVGCGLCSMNNSVITCSQCTAFAGVQYYLSGNNCVSLCAPGTYQGKDATSQKETCLNCSGCATCAGSATYCTSCSSGRLIAGQNTCGNCPGGQWGDTATTCAYCSPNCKTCSLAANNCTACDFSSLGYQLFLHTDNICYESCPAGFFGNPGTKLCAACDGSCNGCVRSNTNCISCAGGHFRVIGSNACTNSCGSGLYGDTNTNLCTVCPIGCSACSMTNSTLSCSACSMVAGVQYYLDSSNNCVVRCSSLFFGGLNNVSQYACLGCEGTCATCNGTAATNCLTCTGTRYLKYLGTECVTTCDDGTFKSSNNQCAPCSSNCRTCVTSATNCQSCGNSTGFLLYLFSSGCVAVCPDRYYPEITNNTCTGCHTSCLRCKGPLETDCLACSTGSLLSSNSTCQSSCGQGLYSLSNVCYPCNPACKQCSSATSCS